MFLDRQKSSSGDSFAMEGSKDELVWCSKCAASAERKVRVNQDIEQGSSGLVNIVTNEKCSDRISMCEERLKSENNAFVDVFIKVNHGGRRSASGSQSRDPSFQTR